MLRTLFGTLAMWLVMFSSAGQSLTGVTSDAPTPEFEQVEAPGAQPASFAITHVSLIDGTGSPPRSDMTVIVRAGRIEFVGPAREEPLGSEIPAVDGRGKFLLPGLIDTHAHVTYLNWRERGRRARYRHLRRRGQSRVAPTAPGIRHHDGAEPGRADRYRIQNSGVGIQNAFFSAPRRGGAICCKNTESRIQDGGSF